MCSSLPEHSELSPGRAKNPSALVAHHYGEMTFLGEKHMWRGWIWTIATLLFVSGCLSIEHNAGNERWFNASLPIHLQHTLYVQEQAFCTQAADQWVPVPEIRFTFDGVREINCVPNVSVEGSSTSVTTGPVSQSLLANTAVSEIGFWRTMLAASDKGQRESMHERQCMTALGWQSTSDTWDGTPSHLNQTIPINKTVMSAVQQGYSHPLVGSGVVALIDVGNSYASATQLVLYTMEIPLYAPERVASCVCELETSYFSTRGFVPCDGNSGQVVKISSNSPIAHWVSQYF